MGVSAVRVLWLAFGFALAGALRPLQADALAPVCPLGQTCTVGINVSVTPFAQRSPIDCWAASLSALFNFYGHPVDQARIMAQFFPPPQIRMGGAAQLNPSLNGTWVDDNGTSFTISSLITDRILGTLTQISNIDIINAIANNQPVYYGDTTHAMLLVQASYQTVPGPFGSFGVNIVGGGAIDPEPYAPPNCPPAPSPCMGPGFRTLQRGELIGTYAAIVTSVN